MVHKILGDAVNGENVYRDTLAVKQSISYVAQ